LEDRCCMPKSRSKTENHLDESIVRRAETLDVLDAIFPFERREQLAVLLTDDDVATVKRLVDDRKRENTIRALVSDLGYLQAWSLATTERVLPWPAPEEMVLAFIADHLTSREETTRDRSHGMPRHVEESLRQQNLLRGSIPHAPSTVRRRIASWAMLTKRRGLSGVFDSSPLKDALSGIESDSGRQPGKMSATAITDDLLARILSTCTNDGLVGLRDRAILLLASAAGGLRRADVANLRVDDLSTETTDTVRKKRTRVPRLTIRMGKPENSEQLNLVGQAADALLTWMAEAGIASGPVFRKVDQWGNVSRRTLTPQSINLIVKTRAKKAGLDPKLMSAQGLRSGAATRIQRRKDALAQ
jgi:integrase